MKPEILYHTVETKLITENRSDSTIKLYLSSVKNFVDFTKKTDVTKIEDIDLINYSKVLFKSKKQKRGTISPIKSALKYSFNGILSINLNLNLIPSPKNIIIEKEYFTKAEMSLFLSVFLNLKHKTIFQLMYALGTDILETSHIKITDINSKKKIVTIRNNDESVKRIAHLPASILSNLREYFIIYKPEKFLFEGQNIGEAISDRTIQQVFKNALLKINVNKNLTTKSIKNSYVKHLTEDGIALSNILENLKITNPNSLKHFSNICFPIINYNSSPFDTLNQITEEFHFFDTTDLEYILSKVTDKEERDYLEEGLKCFKANALRAGVIFLWTASIYKIQKMCLTQSLGFINTELKKIYVKAKEIKVIEDFGYIKDEYLLELACRLKVLDKTKKEELKNTCLDLRNKCGHPGNYKPKGQKIKAFVEDIIGMLYEK
jgi:site-specific recombinase XerD